MSNPPRNSSRTPPPLPRPLPLLPTHLSPSSDTKRIAHWRSKKLSSHPSFSLLPAHSPPFSPIPFPTPNDEQLSPITSEQLKLKNSKLGRPQRRRRQRRRLRLKDGERRRKKTTKGEFTTRSSYRWGGMGNRFRSGCTSCMDWASSTSVRFVRISFTWGGELAVSSFVRGADLS